MGKVEVRGCGRGGANGKCKSPGQCSSWLPLFHPRRNLPDHFRTLVFRFRSLQGLHKISGCYNSFKLKVTTEETAPSSNTNTVLWLFTTRYRNTCPAAAAGENTAAPWKAAKLHTAHAATLRLLTTAGELRTHSNEPQTQALVTRLITFPAMNLLHTLGNYLGYYMHNYSLENDNRYLPQA